MQGAYACTSNFCTVQYYSSQSAFVIYVGNHVHAHILLCKIILLEPCMIFLIKPNLIIATGICMP